MVVFGLGENGRRGRRGSVAVYRLMGRGDGDYVYVHPPIHTLQSVPTYRQSPLRCRPRCAGPVFLKYNLCHHTRQFHQSRSKAPCAPPSRLPKPCKHADKQTNTSNKLAFFALGFTTVVPCETCPSPIITTLSPFRTQRIVVPCIVSASRPGLPLPAW